MFLWCCPRSSKHQHQGLLQSLCEENSGGQGELSSNQKLRALDQGYEPTFKNISPQHNTSQPIQAQKSVQSKAIKPNFNSYNQQNEVEKNRINGHVVPKTPKTKSALWDENPNCDLIFYTMIPHKLRFVCYELRKKHRLKNNTDVLDYLLKKSAEKFNLIIFKELMFQFPRKNYESTNNIFVQLKGTIQSSKNIENIKSPRMDAIRFSFFDQIIIVSSNQNTYEEIKKYCLRVVGGLTCEELKNVIYLFPAFLTLDQISQIIFRSFKKFIRGEPIEKWILDLTFQMELIENGKLDSMIVIKNRSNEVKSENDYYDRRKITLPILMLDYNERTYLIHKNCYINIAAKNLNEFLKFKLQVQNNPSKIEEFSESQNAEGLLKNYELKEYPLENGDFFVVNTKQKAAIEKFNYSNVKQHKNRHDSDTPVKKDWDDDIKRFQNQNNQPKASTLENISDKSLDSVSLDDDEIFEEQFEEQDEDQNEGEMELEGI